ncbi:MAG: SpvB/TcaC N-terminal domain-containing protein [Gammaproteobacteria bacterium]
MPDNDNATDSGAQNTESVNSSPINLPKGGGAIRGIGEKFQSNPVTGSGSFSLPLPISPGRSEFQPGLLLTYDSGSGNSSFGLGWSIGTPSIKRKTAKQLPLYQDTIESDTFLLAGAEDLVPELDKHGNRKTRQVSELGDNYTVYAYRPRIEGLFARIEKWINESTSESHWRVTSKDNITSIYGKQDSAKIVDPHDANHVFEWLIEHSVDTKGNSIVFEYKQENTDNIVTTLSEQQRIKNSSGFSTKHLKRVYYSPFTTDETRYHFQLLFDYGEHSSNTPEENKKWPARRDPFSNYTPGFELRNYRLCQRVLMFHNFPQDSNANENWQLVKSLELSYKETTALSFLSTATIHGYQKTTNGEEHQAMPPVEFTYSKPQPDSNIKQVDKNSLENLPAGLDEINYQWIDLAGEGLPGILSRQAGIIYYKENLGNATFGKMKPVYSPVALAEGSAVQITDLDGDGINELVVRDDTLNGYYKYDADHWQPFTPFKHNPVIDWSDPNLKMLDLSGKGFADILITEDNLFRWYPSEAADGYGVSQTVPLPDNELDGPKIVFSDFEQSIYLADMSGDGRTDIVRIRNGEVSYWPNLGYGRFGAKLFMDDAPRFTEANKNFNPYYIKLGDIDGSGTSDILYLGNNTPQYYLNQAGNSWSNANAINTFLPVDSLSSVTLVDIEAKGTMCLVWSTQLPGQQQKQMSYVDLMGSKPNLLNEVNDNMGSVTRLSYTPSTTFYLEDKKQGKPWITRLSFPIHCLEKVETLDQISGNRFVRHYKYHHGYFDGPEREFRGFGMVEQFDTEEYRALPEASNADQASHIPPVLTKTWYHTGMYLGRDHVSDFYAGLLNPNDTGEYYREPGLSDKQFRAQLLPDTIMPADLSIDEEREATRALKGFMLRQEVYALDNSDKAAIPYSVIEQNFIIQPVQSRGDNRYAVFFTHPREVITYHYERNPIDPRTQHALTLEVDKVGNVLQSLAIGYGRRQSSLPDPRDQHKQTQTLLTHEQNAVTNAIDDTSLYPQDYVLPLPVQTQTFELTGFKPENNAARFSFDEWTRNDFELLKSAIAIPYEQTANQFEKQKRIIEQLQIRYRKDDLSALLPFGQLEPMALPGESYKLAFTPGLLAQVYKRSQPGSPDEDLLPNPDQILAGKGTDQGGYIKINDNWWIPSGKSYFDPAADITNPGNTAAQELATAQAHFYLPRKTIDAFDKSSLVDYDQYDLLISRSTDALGNTITADNDYRVLQPKTVTDPNRNQNTVAFDALGMVVASAVMGKLGDNQGDRLQGFNANPTLEDLQAFIADPHANAAAMLGEATTRIVYDLDRTKRTGQPPFAATLARETHVTDTGGKQTKIQISFSYSDGFGREIQKKIQAEAGLAPQREPDVILPSGDIKPGDLIRDAQGNLVIVHTEKRWLGTGRTVFNNKGKPVKQYEPFFSSTPLYEPESDVTDTGVSSILFYDPVERVITKLHPNHTYEKVVFDPWQQANYDVNDTVAEGGNQTGDPRTDPDIKDVVADYFKTQPDDWATWYQQRINNQLGNAEQEAAQKAAAHVDTPIVEHLDSLGRSFFTIAHNRYTRNGTVTEEQNANRTELDIENNERSVSDAKDRIVMRYDYDLLGNRIHQTNMEAGERWMLNDITGEAIRTWNSRRLDRRLGYDELRRAINLFVSENGFERLAERTVYGEQQGDAINHRGRLFQIYDNAGINTSVAYDFKGNLLQGQRDLLPDYKNAVDWSQNPAANDGRYTNQTTYDALNRPVTAISPDNSIYRPTFNESNQLDRVDVNLRGGATATAFISNINYDAKGQRQKIVYANGALTNYRYDPLTFRLQNMQTTRPSNPDATASQLFNNVSIVQDLFYTYDPVGNLTRIKDAALKTVFNNGQQVNPINQYTYDAIYRLIEAQGREHISQASIEPNNPPNGNYRDHPFVGNRANPNDLQALRNYRQYFEYDVTDNIEVQRHIATGGNWTREYDYEQDSLIEPSQQNNQLTRTTLGNGINRIGTYSHDSHGNMIQMPHLPTMMWDFEDQLQQVDLTAGKAYYVYDASGQRLRKVIENQNGQRQKERLYLGGFEIYREYNANGNTITLERETVHIMDEQQRIALIETRTQGNEPGIPAQLIRYQYSNHQGSASLEFDDNGALITYEEYHPYGTSAFQAGRSAAEVNQKRYRYTNKERDDETGLSYHGFRYYASWLGRWSSTDPIGIDDNINLYVYTQNNPVNTTDPTGLWSWRTVAVIAAVVVVGVVVTVATAGAAAPLVAAAVASIGLTGTAATVTTGVVVGAVAGAVGGAAAGAGGETTRQLVNGEKLDGSRILSEAGNGAVIGGGVGAAIPLVAAAIPAAATAVASTSIGGAVVGATKTFASKVASSSVGQGTSAIVQGTKQVVRAAVDRTRREIIAVKNAGKSVRDRVSKKLGSSSKNGGGVPNPGGRLGKQSTRDHIDAVATEMERRGFNITGGGNRLPEEYLPGPGGGRRGSSFPDITATKNGRTLRVNTVDTRANGITPSTREATNAARIRSQTPGDHLLLIPKP